MANEMVEITIERGGEYVRVEVPEGSTVSALIQDDHLRGINVSSTRVNGNLASPETPLQQGDQVAQVPKSGKQG